MRTTASCIALAALVAVGCATPPKAEVRLLKGMVYDHDGSPVNGASITIDATDPIETDIRGRFATDAIEPGMHKILVRKPGYEALSLEFRYSQPVDVVYVKMFSGQELLDAACDSASREKWTEAEAYVARNEAIGLSDPLAAFVKAMIVFRAKRGKPECLAAVASLDKLLDSGVDEPYIRILIADFLLYRLDDPAGAAAQFRAASQLRADSEIESRLKSIGGN